MLNGTAIHSIIGGSNLPAAPQRLYLLQYLVALQDQYSCVPVEAIDELAAQLELPAAEISGVISFYSFLHEEPRGAYDILFSDNITDRMQGGPQRMGELCSRLGVQPGKLRGDGRVTVDTTSCIGMSDQGPALLVNGRIVTGLDAERTEALAGLVDQQIPLSEWPQEWFQVQDNIRRPGLLLNEPCLEGGALRAFVAKGAEQLLDELDKANLRGRGGAGFPAGHKWRMCRESMGEEHHVVCNADEGEPGTFKDRVLLNRFAHDVFEGMTLCGGVINARRGYLYLRGEYRYLLPQLRSILEQRREDKLLGTSILGQEGFDFDIEIHLGAGAYICGEESALIESLEGKRGVPRNRPPYPVSHGYLGQPTVVNNVETLLAAAHIATRGPDWFRDVGTPGSTGSKLLSISGDCRAPGIYEFPFGSTVAAVLDACGAEDTQAVQISGAAGFTIPAANFDRRIAFEDIPTAGSFMIFNQERDLLDMVHNFCHFFAHESCGFCTPCRVGTSLLRDLVDKVRGGEGSRHDLQQMREIGALMQSASLCGLGTTAPLPVLNTLAAFPQIYASRLDNRDYTPAFNLEASLEDARALRSGSGEQGS